MHKASHNVNRAFVKALNALEAYEKACGDIYNKEKSKLEASSNNYKKSKMYRLRFEENERYLAQLGFLREHIGNIETQKNNMFKDE